MDITERIINHLVMASSFTPNIGLYHGKTGIVIALCHYARFTGKTIYDDFAGELLDEVCSSIHAGMSADLENGLAHFDMNAMGGHFMVQIPVKRSEFSEMNGVPVPM